MELTKLQKSLWQSIVQYDNKIYALVTLNKEDKLYNMLCDMISDRIPKKVEMVQHPTAYLKYLIYSKILEDSGIEFKQEMAYFAIHKSKVDVCLKYNCDSRYLNEDIIFSNKIPEGFHDTIIVVMKRKYHMNSDKNYFPMYVIHF